MNPIESLRRFGLCSLTLVTCAWTAQAQFNCQPLAYNGPVVAGNITQAAQIDCYRFNGNPGEKVRVNMAWGGIAMFLEILDGTGAAVSSTCNSIQRDTVLPGPGPQTFRIRVRDCDSWRTGWYAFSLQRIDTNEGARDLSYTSPPIGGSINQVTLVHRYRFSAQANKVVQFNTAWGGIAMGVEILDAAGARVTWFVNRTTQNVTLPATGIYSLHVRDADLWRTGWYQISMSCVTFPCDATAAARNYGTGWPGTAQVVPELSASAPPRLGSVIDLRIGNSSGADTVAVLFIGLRDNENATPFGGRLMLDPISSLVLPLRGAGVTGPLPVPNDYNLNDLCVHLQVVQRDAGASHQMSFSRGLSLVFGL